MQLERVTVLICLYNLPEKNSKHLYFDPYVCKRTSPIVIVLICKTIAV